MWKSEKFTIFLFVYINIFKRTHGPYINISKHFADHLPTPKCKRNLWRLPYSFRVQSCKITVWYAIWKAYLSKPKPKIFNKPHAAWIKKICRVSNEQVVYIYLLIWRYFFLYYIKISLNCTQKGGACTALPPWCYFF